MKISKNIRFRNILFFDIIPRMNIQFRQNNGKKAKTKNCINKFILFISEFKSTLRCHKKNLLHINSTKFF